MQKFNKNKYKVNLEADAEIFSKIKFNGVKPSEEDTRDYVACLTAEEVFPQEYLSAKTEIFNQGNIGSCVAHACATAMAQGEEVEVNNHNVYSRGYIYGNRLPTDSQEEGMYPRQALKQLNHCGDVLYVDFPYNKKYPAVKKLIEQDAEELAEKALPHAIIDYFRCYSEEQIKRTIMSNGGVLICVPVYTDFSCDLHKTKTNKLKGYHEMIIIGWTKDNKWVVQNSWGSTWGYGGNLLMDMDYPVTEYWGITVQIPDVAPKPEPKSIWQKIADFFVGIFEKIFK